MKGEHGWIAVTSVVVAWDVLNEDTLSAAFKRAIENEKVKPLVVCSWAILTLHLFHAIPKTLDPFHLFLGGIRKIVPRP